MIILVIGLLRYDAGKTTWVMELIELLKEYGVKVIPFKPVGGHNAWYQYNTIKYSIELGTLVGEDAYKLAKVSGLTNMIEILSPVDVLLAPPDPSLYENDYRRYIDDSSLLEKQAILARITLPYGEVYTTTHYVIEDNYVKTIKSLRTDLEILKNKIKNVTRTTSQIFLKLLESSTIIAGLSLIQERLEKESDVLIIESFNNVALPIPSAIKADYVFVVAPGKILLYKGDDYRRALAVYGTVPGLLAYETAPVISLLKNPVLVLDWEPRLQEKHVVIKPSEAAEKALSLVLEKS